MTLNLLYFTYCLIRHKCDSGYAVTLIRMSLIRSRPHSREFFCSIVCDLGGVPFGSSSNLGDVRKTCLTGKSVSLSETLFLIVYFLTRVDCTTFEIYIYSVLLIHAYVYSS